MRLGRRWLWCKSIRMQSTVIQRSKCETCRKFTKLQSREVNVHHLTEQREIIVLINKEFLSVNIRKHDRKFNYWRAVLSFRRWIVLDNHFPAGQSAHAISTVTLGCTYSEGRKSLKSRLKSHWFKKEMRKQKKRIWKHDYHFLTIHHTKNLWKKFTKCNWLLKCMI